MKKVHVKLNRALAVTLSALMVCLSVPMDRVLADTVSPGNAQGTATENTLPDGAAGGADTITPGNAQGTAAENTLPDGAAVFSGEGPLFSFSYTGEAEALADLGLTGAVDKVELSTEDVGGNTTQHIKLNGATDAVVKSWDAISEGFVKIIIEFHQVDKKGEPGFRICDKDGNVLINIAQFGSGNINLYEGQAASGTFDNIGKKARNWIRLETEIDLTASNADHKLKFTTKAFSKSAYTDASWTSFGEAKTEDVYVTTFENASGCATEGLTEFSVGSMVMQATGSTTSVAFDGIEVQAYEAKPEAVMTGIKVKAEPAKKNYAIGEALDTTGLEVQAVMSDGTTSDLTADAYTVSTVDTSTEGYKDVTVTYKENTEFTATFKIRVVDNSVKMQPLFSYTEDADSLEELGLAGEVSSVELSTAAVNGNESQSLYFSAGGTVTKSWDAVSAGTVKINVEFYHNGRSALYRICDKDGNVLINFGQFGSGNINLYEGQDTSGDPDTVVGKKNHWVRMETEIDLTTSNADQKLKFTTNVLYKANYTDADWTLGGIVTGDTYATNKFANANGCATDTLEEFSVGSIALQSKDNPGVTFDNIEVLVPAAAESQSFVYIDEEDVSTLEFEESGTGVLGVTSGEQSGNTTNKLSISNGSVTKTLQTPISTGKVTLETVGYHNGNILGVQILDGAGKNLITYSQQSSGNLNLYKGAIITGGGDETKTKDYTNVGSKSVIEKKWVKVTTEIDLDKSNQIGVLEFAMTVQYKNSYTDQDWTDLSSVTQQKYIVLDCANGAADSSLSSFNIGGLRIAMGNSGTGYMDDIKFNDGNGIEGVVTVKEKVLKSMEITSQAKTKEFPQDSKISTEGLVLTGTYEVTYSNNTKEEKTYKITKYDVECDTSQIADSVPVTIKVTDNGREFTATYNVKIVAKPDGTYVTISYTDEEGMAHTGFDGSKISVASGDTYGNNGNKIKLAKGSSVTTLAQPCTTGTVHFETEFLTTAAKGESLFLRLLNSEGKPMVDIGQYGSGNLNLYIDKKTSGTDGAMAGQFKGLPVKQWAKLSVDIDLEATREQGHLVFDAIVWTKADYAGDWTIHAEFDEDLYLKSEMAPTTTGSASSDATVLDIASIELLNKNGDNFYDNLFFEAIRGDVEKKLTSLVIASPAVKTEYTVGDGLNRTGLVLKGVYRYSFPNGDVKEREAEITKYEVSFDNTQPGDAVPVTLTAEGLSVSYNVLVRPNTALDDIETYLVREYINNKLVTLDDEMVIYMNKRQVKLPVETKKGEKLTWSIAGGDAEVSGVILTVNPSKEKKTEVDLKVTLSTKNNDGDLVSFSKTLKIKVPKESGRAADDSFTTESSQRYVVKTLVDRKLFEGQANLTDVDTIMANMNREITVEEVAVILVNLFQIDTTYTSVRINRSDVEDDAWYSKFVKAAFQLSVETRDSREGKAEYGIGKGISKANLLYMIDRIIHVDQTTVPEDYQDRLFE